MTSGKLLIYLFVAALGAGAFFVWPTIYYKTQETDANGTVLELRVNRWTKAAEVRLESGEWADYRPPVEGYDPVEAVVEDAVHKADQAGKDIRKMSDAANSAMEHSSPVK